MESLGKQFTATRSFSVPHRFELWLNGLFTAGLAMQLGKGLSLPLDGYNFNLGAAYAW